MNIAVVGLGLIGGSFCKSIKKYTDHKVYGLDINEKSVKLALECKAIDEDLHTTDNLKNMDLVIVSLHPTQSINFILENLDNFKKESLVMDTCGIKQGIVDRVYKPLKDKGVLFVGAHPMAGREFSGFEYSLDNLFDNASFIVTPFEDTPAHITEFIKYFAQKLQFGKIVVTTPEEHDRVIAFTSQLAHVVSNAYMKSPSAKQESGFSAGSFQDLTRVAKLDENMWTDLFMLNKKALLFEIDTIIEKLQEYKRAMENDNSEELKQLLREGRLLKEESLKNK